MEKSASSISVTKKRKISRASLQEERAAYLFILPAVICIFATVIIPVFASFYFSLTDYNIIRTPVWKGLANYIKIFTGDRRIGTVYRNTFVYTFFAVVLNVGSGLLLALLLNKKIPGVLSSTVKFCFFIPVVIAYVYVAIVWHALYNTEFGVINYFLGTWGIDKIGWLTNKKYAMPAILLMDTWKNAGYYMVIFLAGLQNIPTQYYEAAKIDGCSGLRMFWKITLPLLTPTLFFNLIWSSINALQAFDSMSILTQGGPGDATRSVVMYIYEQGFQGVRFGYASAIAVTLFACVGLLTFVQFKLSDRWVHY